MTDRRRINGPGNGTFQPTFSSTLDAEVPNLRRRSRKPNELRKIFLQTGLIPTANGSAYLELEAPPLTHSIIPQTSTIKLSCSVHGPKPLPRNAAFSPNLQLTATVKFAPFATRIRRGYVRDAIERDLGVHLENALKGVILPDRWPKSSVEVAVTVLEGEDGTDSTTSKDVMHQLENVGLMNMLAASINVASAALIDARIDCLDILTGGVAALVPVSSSQSFRILDPCPREHESVTSACVVGYLSARDEMTTIWSTGISGGGSQNGYEMLETLLDASTAAAKAAQSVIKEVILESAHGDIAPTAIKGKGKAVMNENKELEMRP